MNQQRPTELANKSSVDQIRSRFDGFVDRFSNLETGQSATVDAPLAMELITRAAVASTPQIHRVLDIGCGAGNNTLKLHQAYGDKFSVDLVDLSAKMLARAEERARNAGIDDLRVWQSDFRDVNLPAESFDVILAAAVLHHLRDDQDWLKSFGKVYRLLKPGGSFWITDLVWHEAEGVQHLMWQRYSDYLCDLGGADYRDQVFAYIDMEDSPRPVTYQLELMRRVGFQEVDILHKNSCFAALGAIKR